MEVKGETKADVSGREALTWGQVFLNMPREMGSLLYERAEKAVVSKADMPFGPVRDAGALFLKGLDKHFLGFSFLLPLGFFLSHLYSDARSKFQKLQICIFKKKEAFLERRGFCIKGHPLRYLELCFLGQSRCYLCKHVV